MNAVPVSCAPPHPDPLPLRGRGDRNGSLSLGEGEGWGEGGRLFAHHPGSEAVMNIRPDRIKQMAREAAIGGYEAVAEAADRLADVYDAVATLIGARPDEIAVVENATRACTIAEWSGAGSSPFSRTAKRRPRRATGCAP